MLSWKILSNRIGRRWLKPSFAQYSYNTQIEVITRDLEATHQELKEGFFEFVTKMES